MCIYNIQYTCTCLYFVHFPFSSFSYPLSFFLPKAPPPPHPNIKWNHSLSICYIKNDCAWKISSLKLETFINTLGKPQKNFLLMAGPLRGGAGKELGHQGKNNFFWNLFFKRSKISTAIKLEGGRGFRP